MKISNLNFQISNFSSPTLRLLLTVFLLASSSLSWVAAEDAPDEMGKKFKAMALLPDGSELKDVMVPRYDKEHHLIGVLRAGAMTLVNPAEVAGRTISVEFFNADQSPRGRIDLKQATFYPKKDLLVARERVELKSDRISASGDGLFYSLSSGKAFLSGRVVTTLKNPVATP